MGGGGGGGGGGSVPWPNPLPFYIPFWTEKVPLSYTFNTLYLFIFFILFFFCYTKCKKERKKKNTIQNKSGEEALNGNHKAYM